MAYLISEISALNYQTGIFIAGALKISMFRD